MKRFWKKYRVWIIIAAVIALLVAVGLMRNNVDPHAGHDHATNPHTQQNADPHAGHDHSNYKVENSYTITTDENGRYTVSVKDAHGQAIISRAGLTTKPTCTKVNDDVLLVGDTTGDALSSRWAVFCDVHNSRASSAFNGVLATKGTYVAYGTNLNNAWQVQVKDAFNPAAYNKVYTLEGAASPDGRSVFHKAELAPNGDLTVSYWAGTTEKTITIPLPQA